MENIPRVFRKNWFFSLGMLYGIGTLILGLPEAQAGGPGWVLSNGTPVKWDTAGPLTFHVDGGGLGKWDNQPPLNVNPVDKVTEAFDLWGPNLPTSIITFSPPGSIPGDGDVDTVSEFNAFYNFCTDDGINPVIFDEDGSLFSALGFPSGIIAIAGPCWKADGEIIEGFAAFNGKWFDGDNGNGELTEAEFEGTLVHEFGHWLNLDHSQTNGNFFRGDTDPGFTQFGSPPLSSVSVMFPFTIGGSSVPVKDDISAISRLYPSGTFTTGTGTIKGTILLPNGVTPFEGANVIARNVLDPFNDAVSNVSGKPFASPSSVGEYELPGLTDGASYSVEIVNVDSAFDGGSSVGPLDPPSVIPGAEEFYNGANEASLDPPDDITVFTSLISTGGLIESGIDVIINGPAADLLITKVESIDPVLAGTDLTYTITVTNNGPDDSTGFTVTDVLPAEVSFVSVIPTPACFHNGSPTGGTVTCNLGPLANGANTMITIVVTPNSAGTIINNATVSGNEGDPDTGNNSASVSTTVDPASSDLSITMADSPDPVLVDQYLTYILTLENNGPSHSTGVSVTDTLPGTASFDSVNSSQGSCSEASGVVSCSLGNINNGSNATVTIVVLPASAGAILNEAVVSSNEGDPDTLNNSVSEGTTVNPASSDLSLTQTDSPDPILVDTNLTYTITVTNNGPSNADGITITDTLDLASMSFESATPTQGTCLETAGTISCDVGSLINGASATLSLVVIPIVTGMVNNTACVAGGASDPDTSNNCATEASLVVEELPKLVNISTRGFVSTGNGRMIGGFFIGGSVLSQNILIRAQGPSLVDSGLSVAEVLANTTIQLFSGATVIAQNDDWQTTDPLCLAPATFCGDDLDIIATGLDPCTASPTGCTFESAILIALPPGGYTVIVEGVGGGTGVGLVEIFEISP